MSAMNLLELSPAEIVRLVEDWGEPAFRGRQLATWIYARGVRDFAAMSDLPRSLRLRLLAEATVSPPEIREALVSQDGSRKLVVRLADGRDVHAVLMPDRARLTLCLSTQVGCGFRCAFCATGTMGLTRNLGAGEIVGQVFAARATLAPPARLTHIVFMGMGEPLANYEATVAALRTLCAPTGFGFSPRRITVSTVGLVKGIERLAREDLRVNLAISLHAASDEVRSLLIPANRGVGVDELLESCRRFPLAVRQRITFEYVLLDGVNDRVDDARRLARRLSGLRAKVNLIPFNPWEGASFRRPPEARIAAFQRAACGPRRGPGGGRRGVGLGPGRRLAAVS
jgi:23S rRNA (adenine2503-C2)-methyltransferase